MMMIAPIRGRRRQTSDGAGSARAALLSMGSLLAMIAGSAAAQGQDTGAAASGSPAVQEIVVTAQKRQENINAVPMSITAATGATLQDEGVLETRDLVKLTPGFSYADSYVGSPIYTIRGVGFSDISLGGRPTVSIYVDEAPIPFAIETRGAVLDLDRVEVLKGPQGTLFGQNSTGGAINYIDAKPTSVLRAGLDLSYGNFDSVVAGGYLSGPLTDTLDGRISFNHTSSGDWQRSYTTGAKTGAGEFNSARAMLAWRPGDRLKVNVSLSGWVDNSDTQASQLIGVTPATPAAAPLVPGLLTYPLAPQTPTAADFNPGLDYQKNNAFVQATARADYALSAGLTLTSLTSFSHYAEHQLQDIDGTSLSNLSEYTVGSITSYYEELRLAGEIDPLTHFVAGSDFASDEVRQRNLTEFPQSTTALTFLPLGLPLFKDFVNFGNQQEYSYAFFANVDRQIVRTLKAYAGVRYTEADDRFDGCSADAGDGLGATDFGVFQNYVRSLQGLAPNPPVPLGGCITANAAYVPGLVVENLDQNNVSWRAGLEWTPVERLLLYANVSKGYKAGGFPDLGATTASQYTPATQESILAYELGFKDTLLDRTLQISGAVYAYDYRNKQILGRILDPLFGPLLKLVNVPRSQIQGAELQVAWAPIRGLTVTGGASYVDSAVLGDFTNYDPNGVLMDFRDEAFPNTPRWQLVGDVGYKWGLTSTLNAFAGANASYQSRTNSELGESPLLTVKAYSLVDLRLGVETPDGRIRLWAWGRNVGDTYYWTAASRDTDTTTRFAGYPATYGATLSIRFH